MRYAVAHAITLETESCCNCNIVFAIPSHMQQRLKEKGGSFWCPNGHEQHYTQTEVTRLREKLAEQTREATRMAERARAAELAEQAAADREIATAKELRRVKKHVQAGVCTCCNRTFPNLARHMATKHKDAIA